MKRIIAIFGLIFTLMSCDVINQVTGITTLAQCEYKYNNINDIQLAGINLGKGTSISLANFATISTILSGGSMETIPLSMTLMLDVINPNTTTAFLSALDYDILINDMELTTGQIDTPLRIDGGSQAVLPITVGVNLKNVMDRYSRDKVSKEMSGFLGLSSEPTKVKVNIWPKLKVGGTPIRVPAAIPIEFTFGGKK